MRQRIAILVAVLTCAACTDNEMAKSFGGTMTVTLPPGVTLVNATWKDSEFWYLTRPRRAGETPTEWTFKEKSTFGMAEGTVLIKEQ